MTVSARFGEKLRALRLKQRMTLSEMAVHLGYTTHSYLSEIESGQKTPTVAFVLRTADLFGVSTDTLLRDDVQLRLAAQELNEEINMKAPFAQRPPTAQEMERIRLILSTYQDGAGMLTPKKQYDWIRKNRAVTIPGWRDFERTVVVAIGGRTGEDKHVYDVWLPDPAREGVMFGISCKMRKELRQVETKGRGYIELTNANKALWQAVKDDTALNETTYTHDPDSVGRAIIDIVNSWHSGSGIRKREVLGKNTFDHTKGLFLNLLYHEPSGQYQMFQFTTKLPASQKLHWQVRPPTGSGMATLLGRDETGVVLEWFPGSGGQLKYYPLVREASWQSEIFFLEPLPADLENLALFKASSYFPNLWANSQ